MRVFSGFDCHSRMKPSLKAFIVNVLYRTSTIASPYFRILLGKFAYPAESAHIPFFTLWHILYIFCFLKFLLISMLFNVKVSSAWSKLSHLKLDSSDFNDVMSLNLMTIWFKRSNDPPKLVIVIISSNSSNFKIS